MENNYNNNLNNQNGVSDNQNSGVKTNAPSFSGTPQQTTSNTSQTTPQNYSSVSSRYIRPEDIVRENSADSGNKTTPVFAYSKSTNANPYLPSGYSPSTETPIVSASTGTAMKNQTSTGEMGQTPNASAVTPQAEQAQVSELNFGATQPEETKTPTASSFEVVGNKVPTAVSKAKKVNTRKLNASRKTESRFCGHFAWFFSIANIFVCLFFILVNILLSQVAGEGAQENEIVVTLNSIIKIAPYATLVVCAFTLIALINSIVQLTIRVNKYSKLTIIIVFVLSIAAFVYLYFVGYLGETLKLLSLATS